eukprot:490203-Rhodomonas_salina.1
MNESYHHVVVSIDTRQARARNSSQTDAPTLHTEQWCLDDTVTGLFWPIETTAPHAEPDKTG